MITEIGVQESIGENFLTLRTFQRDGALKTEKAAKSVEAVQTEHPLLNKCIKASDNHAIK